MMDSENTNETYPEKEIKLINCSFLKENSDLSNLIFFYKIINS